MCQEIEITIKAVSTDEALPEIVANGLISKDVLFLVGDKWYSGYYHKNGCFYAGDNTMAKTKHAETLYPIAKLPKQVATHWAKIG